MNFRSQYNQHSFAVVPEANIQRSFFDRSFTVKDTFDFDYLNPIFLDEIIPGDTINLKANVFARLATQKVPILDNLYVDYFFFFVPCRLLWTNWEKFMGAQDNPGDSISYTIPQMVIPAGGPEVGELADKFGLPTDITAGYQCNALPFRAYNLIYNTWFRDENLQNSITVDKDDGTDAIADYVLKKRGRRHDYFTSCLTSPTKGITVSLPLGTSAPVNLSTTTGVNQLVRKVSDHSLESNSNSLHAALTTGALEGNGAGVAYVLDPNGTLYTDLSTATSATLTSLRESMMLQSLYEQFARGGTRYVEIILAHFNVTSPDFRLARPEFLGGGTSRINIHPVAQTAITSGSNALGQLAAFGTMSTLGQNIGFNKSFTEHGYVIGLACARADLSYQHGMNKLFSRSTRLDFFWPKLQQMSDQAVLKGELYKQGTSDDTTVWGYQERYGEMRFKQSEIHGKFRSSYASAIDQWHMAEELSALPSLNSTYIVQNTPIDRAIAVTNEPHILFDCWYDYKHARPIMSYGVPATFGRF